MASSVNVFDGLKAQLVAMRKGKKHKSTEAPDFVTFFLASGEVQCQNVRMASWIAIRDWLGLLAKSADASAMNYGTVVHQLREWLARPSRKSKGAAATTPVAKAPDPPPMDVHLKEWLESDRRNGKRAVPTADPTTATAEHAPARSKPALGQPHAKKLRLQRKCTQLQPRSTAPVAVPRDPHAAPATVHRSTCRRVISARPRCAEVHGGARATPDTADATMNSRLKKTETASKQNSRAAGKEESSSG